MELQEVQGLTEQAVQSAAGMGFTLDFTPESVSRLEELLQMIYSSNQTTPFSERALWNVADAYGSYLGECLLRNGLSGRGFAWGLSPEGTPALLNAKKQISPIAKVHKRLVNGPEDSVLSFYDVAFDFNL